MGDQSDQNASDDDIGWESADFGDEDWDEQDADEWGDDPDEEADDDEWEEDWDEETDGWE